MTCLYAKLFKERYTLPRLNEKYLFKSHVLDEGGQGVLHLAAALGYDWALQPTIISGVNVNFCIVNGWTALHWAAFCVFEARNLTEEERKGYKEVTWDDKEVCGFYMVRDWHKRFFLVEISNVQALLSDKEELEKDLKRLNDKLTSASLTIMLKVSEKVVLSTIDIEILGLLVIVILDHYLPKRFIANLISLAEINLHLTEAQNTGGVCFSLGKGMYRVLYIPEDEAVLLNSREKVPYMICVEVLRCDMISNSKDTSSPHKLSILLLFSEVRDLSSHLNTLAESETEGVQGAAVTGVFLFPEPEGLYL
ncbi:hypothetical protein S83_066687, partial [Arachis hypogaea]